MIAVLQRASTAAVRVEGRVVGEIGAGLLILLGVSDRDCREDAERLAAKIAKCRIFQDAEDKMNLSLLDVGGEALVISNFTLYADCTSLHNCQTAVCRRSICTVFFFYHL